ncbi:hypothetical protein [Rhizobium leguminosarum]|uniref:hypothetical protein n=1 Tax=Rhizobium leguminosarum TaxID=384 RepID=UPI0015DBAE41|nr:hypothetical protein [Rhizobium leguminosarum]NZD50534.1 hypothetical protein [Rhizobium leguminosarum]
MLLKMIAGLSGPEFNLAPGDEREFDDAEAGRLIDAGFAVMADTPAPTEEPAKTKKGKANVVSAPGNAAAE